MKNYFYIILMIVLLTSCGKKYNLVGDFSGNPHAEKDVFDFPLRADHTSDVYKVQSGSYVLMIKDDYKMVEGYVPVLWTKRKVAAPFRQFVACHDQYFEGGAQAIRNSECLMYEDIFQRLKARRIEPLQTKVDSLKEKKGRNWEKKVASTEARMEELSMQMDSTHARHLRSLKSQKDLVWLDDVFQNYETPPCVDPLKDISEIIVISFLDDHRVLYWSSDRSAQRYSIFNDCKIKKPCVDLLGKKWPREVMRGYYVVRGNQVEMVFEPKNRRQFKLRGRFENSPYSGKGDLIITDLTKMDFGLIGEDSGDTYSSLTDIYSPELDWRFVYEPTNACQQVIDIKHGDGFVREVDVVLSGTGNDQHIERVYFDVDCDGNRNEIFREVVTAPLDVRTW